MKNSKATKAILALILCAAIVVGILAIAGVFNGKEEEKPVETTPVETTETEKPAEGEPAATTEAIKVGIINLDPAESGYREANVNDMKATFTAENGYDAKFVTAPTADKQLDAARGFITDGVKYILVSAADTTGWDEVLKEAKDAGIGVFLFDRMIDASPDLYTAAVVSDMALEGDTAVAWLESLGLEEYKILHIKGQLGSAAQVGRSGALEAKAAADDKWTIVREGTGGDSWDPEEARKIAQSAIDEGLEFNVVYAENDGMAQGVVKALDAAGITHGTADGAKVIVMGFDCNKWALRELQAGNWNYDGQCSPFQAGKIDEMIKTLEKGGTIEGLNELKQFINPEKGFDAKTITEEDIVKYGLGEDPGPIAKTEPAAATEAIKVGIINLDPAESGYREANVSDMKNTFTAENGYDAKFVTAPTADKQLDAARGFITDGVKYILVSAADTTGWDEVLKEAKDAGIGVFLFDRMVDASPDLYTAAVVSDMNLEGDTAVAWLESLGLEEYKILHIKGQLGSAAQVGRSGALEAKAAADDKWTIVREGTGGDSWDPEEARKIAQSAIDEGLEFNVVYAENDGMAQGVVKALDAAGITHGTADGAKVIVMGFDCNKWALRELLAGNWNYDGQCSPFQAAKIDEMIKTLENGGTIEGLNELKQFINPEKGFDAKTITQEDIDKYGLGE